MEQRGLLAVSANVAMRHRIGRSTAALATCLLCCTALIAPASAQEKAESAPDANAPEIVVTGSLNALPLKNVGSVFGFDKTLVETPRSASSVSSEQLDRFGITQIYDLVSQVPGTFPARTSAPAAHSKFAARRARFTSAACCGWRTGVTTRPRSARPTVSISCAAPPHRSTVLRRPAAI